jgi:aminoethylphosphonate catabolism LysR family transcriptional regulator
VKHLRNENRVWLTIREINNIDHCISRAYKAGSVGTVRQSQLKAFHNVALHGGFSRAAEALFLSQPAVSEQVKKLEQDYDVLLFYRERKQVRLTVEGEKLFLLTKKFFEVEDQIEEYMSETRAVIDGTLRIIVDSAHHVTGILGKFRERFPKIHVSIRTGNSEVVLNELRSYNAEIGVVGSLSPGNDMVAVDLGTTPIVAFAAKDAFSDFSRAYSLKELAKMPLVLRESGSKTRKKLEEEARKQGVRLSPVIEAEGREAIHEIVASGAGIGFVSKAEFGRDNRLMEIPLKGVDIQMSETLIYLGQRRNVRVIRAFMDFAEGYKPRVS